MHVMNRAYLGYIHYMHSNHEYFWRDYELNEYLAKICMHSLLRPLVAGVAVALLRPLRKLGEGAEGVD